MDALQQRGMALGRFNDQCYDLRFRQGSCSSFASDFVDFEGESDQADPKNWSSAYKWSLVIVISLISLSVNLAILTSAPATPAILREFHSTSQLEATALVSIWQLGEAIGPLILAPLSELYGRLPVYHGANMIFIVLSLSAAWSTSIQMLIVFRFLLGISVVSLTLNSCIVGDIFPPEQRGRALSVMAVLPYVAPCLGPTMGGFVSGALGWRWTFRITAIGTAVLEIVLLVILRETYKVIIIEKKAANMRRVLKDPTLCSRYSSHVSRPRTFLRSFTRPITLLFTSKIIFLVSICGAFAMGHLYIVMTTLTPIFEQVYDFPEAHVGLSFLGLGFGMSGGILITGYFLDWHLKRERCKGNSEPEVRLPPMAIGYIMVPIGIVCLGWSVERRAHWIVPILSPVLVGAGFAGVALSAWSYLVDSFGIYAASATAGAQIFRCLTSAALPLAVPGLTDRIGIGLSSTVFATVALVFVPLPIVLMRYGKLLRGRRLQSLD